MLGCAPATGNTLDLQSPQSPVQRTSSVVFSDISDKLNDEKNSITAPVITGARVGGTQNSELVAPSKPLQALPDAHSTNLGSPDRLPIYYASQPIFLNGNGKDDGASEWTKPSNWISGVAFLLSLGLAIYTARKDTRARRLSINDEYWLRKVVGPIAIEPLLKSILDMIATAPEDNSSASFNQASVNTYHNAQVNMLSLLAVNATTLQLIDATLATSVASQIDLIQDALINYCGAQQCPPGTTGCINKDAFQLDARAKLISLLNSIKVAHTSIR